MKKLMLTLSVFALTGSAVANPNFATYANQTNRGNSYLKNSTCNIQTISDVQEKVRQLTTSEDVKMLLSKIQSANYNEKSAADTIQKATEESKTDLAKVKSSTKVKKSIAKSCKTKSCKTKSCKTKSCKTKSCTTKKTKTCKVSTCKADSNKTEVVNPTPAPVASAKPTTTPAPVASAKPTTTPAPVASAKPTTTAAPIASAKPTATAAPVATSNSIRDFQIRVIQLVNQERASYGVNPLTENAEIAKIATIKSQDMADLNYFDHTSPTYGSPFEMLTQFGVKYTSAGENIAMGQRTPEEVMKGWMNSEGHRKNILSTNYTQIGVGIAKNSKGQYYWTQTFLRN